VIAGDLGRITDVSWVVTAYVVAAAAATPLWGKLGDRLGSKRMLELALRDQRGGVTAASLLRSES
jgi:MFS family permease